MLLLLGGDRWRGSHACTLVRWRTCAFTHRTRATAQPRTSCRMSPMKGKGSEADWPTWMYILIFPFAKLFLLKRYRFCVDSTHGPCGPKVPLFHATITKRVWVFNLKIIQKIRLATVLTFRRLFQGSSSLWYFPRPPIVQESVCFLCMFMSSTVRIKGVLWLQIIEKSNWCPIANMVMEPCISRKKV